MKKAMNQEVNPISQCSRFYCEITKEFTCCACCSQRESCSDPCLNHPSKCNLSIIPRKKVRKRKFTDGQAFKLWQQGYSDDMIAKAVGVSRQRIHAWRDVLELPATDKKPIDTTKYFLMKQSNGESIILVDKKK